MKTIYISHEILNWITTYDSSGSTKIKDPMLPYKILSHAEDLLKIEVAGDDHYRSDTINSLKRAVFLRIDNLNSIYKFKQNPYFSRKTGLFEIMEKMGIIRPLMLNHLVEIRNAVEHRYKDPPSYDQCAELCEFAWYFLRTTDHLVTRKIDNLKYIYEYSDEIFDKHWLYFTFSDDTNWRLLVRMGWLPHEYISLEEKPDWIKLKDAKNESFLEYKIRKTDDVINKYRKNLDTDHIIYSGYVVSPQKYVEAIMKDYFSVLF